METSIKETQEELYPVPEGYSWKTLWFCGLFIYHLYKDEIVVGIITPGTWNDEDLWSALDKRGPPKRVLRDVSLLKASEALVQAVCLQ